MIRGDRQLSTTLGLVDRFERAIEQLRHNPSPSDPQDSAMRRIQLSALESQLETLKREAEEYEALRAGKVRRQRVESFGELPEALISGRIAAGLTQRQLAERLGLKEQQIQRYEATEYRSASMDRVSEVASALGLKIRADVRLPKRSLAS
jgi:ribosome-binding protein aMBF1 (putative translation factor)